MRCLILGGAGFIGSHIVDALVERGHRVRVFDRPNIDLANLQKNIHQIEVCQGDFNNIKDISKILPDMRVVVNLVWTTLPGPSNENPLYDIESNLKGNVFLLEQAVRVGVEKIIFASSGGTVYGVPKQLPITEEHPTDPFCSYGITKLAVEKYLKLFKHLHGLEHTILRIGNPYGERQRISGMQGVIAVFLGKILRDIPLQIWGDGRVARDFLYIDDLTRAFVKVIEQPTPSSVYNIGSGSSCSIKMLLSIMTSITGKTPEVMYQPSRDLDVPEIALDSNKARGELGWKPRVSLEEGMERTWAWLKDNCKK